MENIPESIFIQVGDVHGDEDFSDLVGVTFNKERVFKSDIEYINADIVKAILKRISKKHNIKLYDL